MRLKKAARVCQQRSHRMAPKTGKKRYGTEQDPAGRRHRAKPGAKRATQSDIAATSQTSGQTSGQRSTQSRATGPKPPRNGYFLWGRHAVLAALANPERRIAALYTTTEAADEIRPAIAGLSLDRRDEVPTPTPIERHRLDLIDAGAGGEKTVHQGMVAAVWPLEAPDLEDIIALSGDTPLRLIILDQLSDPRNVGAIMRSARAFGATAIITTHRNAPEESGVLARTAAGALEHVPLVRVVNLARAIETLQAAGIIVAGLAGEGEEDVGRLSDFDRLAIVMGAEGSGLRRLTRDHCDVLVRIPIDAAADSLNVSNAAAIALYAAGTAQAK